MNALFSTPVCQLILGCSCRGWVCISIAPILRRGMWLQGMIWYLLNLVFVEYGGSLTMALIYTSIFPWHNLILLYLLVYITKNVTCKWNWALCSLYAVKHSIMLPFLHNSAAQEFGKPFKFVACLIFQNFSLPPHYYHPSLNSFI